MAMRRGTASFWAVVVGILFLADSGEALGQKALLDELIIIATQGTKRGKAVRHERAALDRVPVPRARAYHAHVPKERIRLEVREVPPPTSGLSQSRTDHHGQSSDRRSMGEPIVQGVSHLLMVPERPGSEGPVDGWTLDAAIHRVIQANLELMTQAHEIPIAKADALQARLPKNPWLFTVVDGVPYGKYRKGKPGDLAYGTTIVFPVDLTGKYKAQGAAGQQTVNVIEAQYRDAVRRQVDELHQRWVEVLGAREKARFAQATVDHLDQALAMARSRRPADQIDALEIERELASYLVEQERSRLKTAHQALAELLNLPPQAADGLQVRDRLDRRIDLPPDETLIEMALRYRPDLIALRQDVHRAHLDVRVARAHFLPDIWVLATPFNYRQFPIEGEQDSVAWGGGVLASIPIIDRNQGNIRHAELTVGKTIGELRTIERRVITEVQVAAKEVRSSRQDLDRLDQQILPMIKSYREQAIGRYIAGQISDDHYMSVLQKAHLAASKYHQVLVHHRRALLDLNTALGCRFVP